MPFILLPLVLRAFLLGVGTGIGDRASLAEEPGGAGGGRHNCLRFVAVLRDASDRGRSGDQVAAQRLYPDRTPAHRGKMEKRVCS